MQNSSSSNRRIGKYDIGKVLGKGNFSKVRVATDSTTAGERYAIKIIDKALLARDHLEDQIRREISILKVLRHKYIVQMREAFQTSKHMYVVMELVEGGELFDIVAEQGRLSEDLARKYFQQLIVAVRYCHANKIAHRDLKLENLLLDKQGNLKVSDFGLANMQPTPESSVMRTVCGTPNYVAPEVIKMNKSSSSSSSSQSSASNTTSAMNGYNGFIADLWSCGIILFIMLSGRQAFDDDDLKALFNKIERGQYQMSRYISDNAKSLIEKLLCVDPNKRLTLEQIIQHPWFQVGFDKSELQVGAAINATSSSSSSSATSAASSLAVQQPDEEAVKNAVTTVEGGGLMSPMNAPLNLNPSALGGSRAQQQQQQQLRNTSSPEQSHSSSSPDSSSPVKNNNTSTNISSGFYGVGETPCKLSAISENGLDAFQLSHLLLSSALTASPFVDLSSSSSSSSAASPPGSPMKKTAATASSQSSSLTTSHNPVFGGIRHFLVIGNTTQAYTAASDWLKTILPSALRSGGGAGGGGGSGGGGANQPLQELRGFLTTPRGIMTFVMEVYGTSMKNVSLIVAKKGMGDTSDFLESLRGLNKRLVDQKILLSEIRSGPGGGSSPPSPSSSGSSASASSSPSPLSNKRTSPEQGGKSTSTSLPAITSQRKVLGASPK